MATCEWGILLEVDGYDGIKKWFCLITLAKVRRFCMGGPRLTIALGCIKSIDKPRKTTELNLCPDRNAINSHQGPSQNQNPWIGIVPKEIAYWQPTFSTKRLPSALSCATLAPKHWFKKYPKNLREKNHHPQNSHKNLAFQSEWFDVSQCLGDFFSSFPLVLLVAPVYYNDLESTQVLGGGACCWMETS